jgi:hypothetical protein
MNKPVKREDNGELVGGRRRERGKVDGAKEGGAVTFVDCDKVVLEDCTYP